MLAQQQNVEKKNLASYSIYTPKNSTIYVLFLYRICNLLLGNQAYRLPMSTSVNKLPPRKSQKDKFGKYKIIFRENKRYDLVLLQDQQEEQLVKLYFYFINPINRFLKD